MVVRDSWVNFWGGKSYVKWGGKFNKYVLCIGVFEFFLSISFKFVKWYSIVREIRLVNCKKNFSIYEKLDYVDLISCRRVVGVFIGEFWFMC